MVVEETLGRDGSGDGGDGRRVSDKPSTTHVTGADGLSAADVARRVASGLVNDAGGAPSRTVVQILRANILTRFNAILGTMLAIVLVFGSPQDGLFGGVLVANSLIGIIQEYRAKRTLDRLAVVNAPVAHLVRDGQVADQPIERIVLDDLLELRAGDQVPADGVVRDADGLELDESLLTGESDAVPKGVDDGVLSGSIVVAGSGRVQATRIGADSYARQLATEARRFTVTRSDLVDGVNRILRYVTWALFVVTPVLFWSQLRSDSFSDALTSAVAGVVGMVPEGLVLLTSIAFGLAAVTLARRQVLVQELPAVEGLARVDVVCLDKTGTLTEGRVVFDRIETFPDADGATVRAALGAIAEREGANATQGAIADGFDRPDDWTRTATIPFSSARKWSATSFAERGSWVLGAPEMVWPDAHDPVREQADEIAATGSRVLLLAQSDAPLSGQALPAELTARALVILEEQVRPDAADALAYFHSQDVTLKVISGDNPRTVGAVARRVGLVDIGEPYDARELPTDREEMAEVLETHTVFGRVSPQQKRAMVGALQSRGHTVAMTGDGVNDALALKDADIGVAMGSGASATRAVAQIVLLDGRFASMPGVVAEGRRVMANIERVANLFITKTTYAALLALAVSGAGWPYPFLPRHLTVISSLTIGIPAFFLAFAPNNRRYVPGFVGRVLRLAIPAGMIAGATVFLAYGSARAQGVGTRSARTTATLVMLAVGLWVLVILARPFTRWRLVLVACMYGAVGVGAFIPFVREFFDFEFPRLHVLAECVLIAAGACAVLEVAYRLLPRRFTAPEEPRIT